MKTQATNLPVGHPVRKRVSLDFYRDPNGHWFVQVEDDRRIQWTSTYTQKQEALREAFEILQSWM